MDCTSKSRYRFAICCIPLLFLATIVTLVLGFISRNQQAASRQVSTISGNQMTLQNTNRYAAGRLEGIDSKENAKVISSRVFDGLVLSATAHPRKRKMTDLTKNAESNSMQTLINTWINGSFSPIHKHEDYSEAFVVLHGALAFFTFKTLEDGSNAVPTCYVLHSLTASKSASGADRVIIVERHQWHAMTAAPPSKGWPGYAVVFETSGHSFDIKKPTKVLAPFAPVYGDGMDGDPAYFEKLLSLCPSYTE